MGWSATASRGSSWAGSRWRRPRDGLIPCGLRWLGRRRGLASLPRPARRVGGPAGGGLGLGLGVAGPVLTLDAYPMAVAALLLTIPALAVSAAMDRSAWRTYGAIVVGVAAAYLTLFELGRGRTGHVSTLGVLASLLAVVDLGDQPARLAGGAGRTGTRCSRSRSGTRRSCWRSWRSPPGWGRPGPLLLASVPFLLLIKAVPTAGWLYPALALMLASGAFAVADRWGPRGSDALGGRRRPFGCWGLGLGLARWKPAVCRRLGLPAEARL